MSNTILSSAAVSKTHETTMTFTEYELYLIEAALIASRQHHKKSLVNELYDGLKGMNDPFTYVSNRIKLFNDKGDVLERVSSELKKIINERNTKEEKNE